MFRTTKRTLMSVLTMTMIAGMAIAQAPQPAPGAGGGGGGFGGGAGGGGGRGGGRRGGGAAGKITAVSADSISLMPPANPNNPNAPTAVTTAIPAGAKFMTLTAAKAEDVKSGSYAIVRAGGGGRGQGGAAPTELNANAVIVMDKAPADTAGATGFGQTTGIVTVADGKMSIKAGENTLPIVSSENTVYYVAKDATAADAKVDGNAMLVMAPPAEGGGAPTLGAIYLLPAGDIPAGLTRGGGRGGRGGGGGRGGNGGGGAAPGAPAAPAAPGA